MKQSGIELIAQERRKQIEEKGYNMEWVNAHPELYEQQQFVDAAVLSLLGRPHPSPVNWPVSDIHRLVARADKGGIDSLIVAGALIAAEIDRLQALEG